MLIKKYGIYSPRHGEKLNNSDELLMNKERFWGPLTESVLDRTVCDLFGILHHPLYISNELYWIVRESKKWKLKFAVRWHRGLSNDT